jgi:hypothetical protein
MTRSVATEATKRWLVQAIGEGRTETRFGAYDVSIAVSRRPYVGASMQPKVSPSPCPRANGMVSEISQRLVGRHARWVVYIRDFRSPA